MTTPYVIGIGNAVMDVIAPTSDESLSRLGIERASCSWWTARVRNS